MYNILAKHWYILKAENPFISERPKIIYRRAPSLRDKLVKNIVEPPAKMIPFFQKPGFYPCRKCVGCKNSGNKKMIDKFTSKSTGKTYITCNSTHVTYMIECPCGLQYIGRTIRQMKVLNEY